MGKERGQKWEEGHSSPTMMESKLKDFQVVWTEGKSPTEVGLDMRCSGLRRENFFARDISEKNLDGAFFQIYSWANAEVVVEKDGGDSELVDPSDS